MTDISSLYIQVGGLCLVVQQPSRKRLYVLLPDLEQGSDQTHCCFLHVSAAYSDRNRLERIRDQSIDLSTLAVKKPDVRSFTNVALPVSKLAGRRALATYLDDPIDAAGPLGARIVLPLPSDRFQPLGKRAAITVFPKNQPQGTYVAYGRLGIRYDLVRPVASLTVPGVNVPLKADSHGAVELALLNIRPQDLGEKPERVGRRTVLHHHSAYYELLGVTNPLDQPTHVSSPDDQEGDPPRKGMSCAEVTFKPFPRWGVDFPNGEYALSPTEEKGIEPYNCTVGGGCAPPNTDAC